MNWPKLADSARRLTRKATPGTGTWRTPGFAGKAAPHSDNSVQWLAQQIVDDERFAQATVEFWWPAIMGSEVAEPPEDESDADFEGLLLAANAQGAEVERLVQGASVSGFRGGSPYNLKDLLVEIVLSDWFRAEALEDTNPVRRVALRHAGAKRLLTPEELDRKTAALTGVKWGQQIRHRLLAGMPHIQREAERVEQCISGSCTAASIPTESSERARDITSVMAGVAKRHAAHMSCPIIMRELYLLPEAERRLFSGIDTCTMTPVSEFGSHLRNRPPDWPANAQTAFARR